MGSTNPQARRAEVERHDPIVGDRHVDYADAFEIELADPDSRTAEEFARAALEGSPPALRDLIWFVHRYVIGFALAPRSSADHVLGWTIRTAEPDIVVLEAESRLARARLVGRRLDSTRRSITTYLFYRRPLRARALWSLIGPIHRWAAPYLLEQVARRTPTKTSGPAVIGSTRH